VEYTLAVEGQPTVDHRLIRPGALTWDTPMPVYGPRAEGEWSSPIIGTIESVRRVEGEDGRSDLLATIAWFHDGEPTGQGLCAQVDAVQSDYEVTGDSSPILTGGRIRAAFIGLPAWPDTLIGSTA
jgi:hypothetical protein